ncbi:hypothetical protein QFC20_007204 [Naganishia adeliensis]|uniref:Uncharacterized protein n=1 Tax=Naganishia adeliensis TaxID=92952 RepID=A0ACC2V245_9TREE|nr:hypothetical protein QFC20_007204 [Naganishia adeliensis]
MSDPPTTSTSAWHRNATRITQPASQSLFKPLPPFSFQQTQGSSIRKHRNVASCVNCRKRKTKCDRVWPCTPCKLRKEEGLCVEYVKEPIDRPTGYTHVVDFGLLSQRVVQLENILSRLVRRVDNPQEYEDLLVELEPIVAVKGEEKRGRGKVKAEGQAGEEGLKELPEDGEDEYDEDEMTPSVGEGSRRLSSSVVPQGRPTYLPPVQALPVPPTQTQMPTLSTPITGNMPLHAMYPDSSLLTHRTSTGIGDIVSPTHPRHAVLGRERSSTTGSFSGAAGPYGYQQPRLNQLAHANGRVVTPSELDQWSSSGNLSISALQQHTTAGDAAQTIGGGAGIGIGVEPPSRAPSETEHAAALTLEDMALGRGQNIERAAFGRGEVEDVDAAFGGIGGGQAFGQAGGLKMVDPAKGTRTPDRVAGDHPGLKNLPSPLQAQYIIDFYLRNIDYLIRCIHVPTFRNQCRALWTRAAGSPYTLEEMSFVALYAACLTVGLHLMSEPGRRDLGLTDEVAARLTGAWWDVCLGALEKADWMQVHSITGLQAVMSEYHWTLCGTAIKIAYALGLSRLGPENPTANYEEVRKSYGSRWAGAIDREVARRVWYALEHNYTYTIQMESNKTAEPANVNDEDLVNGKPIVSQPKDVHTGMSYVLNRLQLLYPLQRLVQQVNLSGRQRYTYVMEAHSEFEVVIDNMSAFYRSNAGITHYANDAESMRQIAIESEVLKNAINLRLLRLHRVYFAQSFQDSKYMLSREVCLNSAFAFLEAFSGPVAPSVEARYWPQTYGLFTSSVILYLNLCRVPDAQVEKAASDVQRGINALRRISGLRGLHGTADALQKLLNEEFASRRSLAESKAAGKRKASDAFPDDRSSKKHYTDAQTPSVAGSGTTPLINQPIDFDNNLSLFTDLPFLSEDQNIMDILNFTIPDLDYSAFNLTDDTFG